MSIKNVRAQVAAAIGQQRLKPRLDLPCLKPGDAYKSIRPGQWDKMREGAQPNGLPIDCPVIPLGIEGENYFMIDANGQLFATGDKAFGQERLQKIFGEHAWYLYWAWPRLKHMGQDEPPLVTGWKPELAREALFVACSRKGPWGDFERVRGRGAWRGPDGRLILHSGEYLWLDGRLAHAGVELDGFFYPRRQRIPGPAAEPIAAEDDVGLKLLRFFQAWNWKRPKVDPVLLLGWIGAAMMSGAMKWRPSIFLTGDRATGKSTLQDALKALLGAGLISTPETTAAGIYQKVRNDALPIAVDELEADADNRRGEAVIKLARIAASGGLMLRGGSDGSGVEFQARSCFIFSAIVPPPLRTQDLSRIALLMLDTLDVAQERPILPDPTLTLQALLRRFADGWAHFDGLLEAYRDALRAGGHDSRGQDTYGTFLACAHMMLGEQALDAAGLPYEDLSAWGQLLEATALPEREGSGGNWRLCLNHLLTSRVEQWRSGVRTTVGQLLDDLRGTDAGDHKPDFNLAKRELAHTGLGLLNKGALPDHPNSYVLAIPNRGPLVASLYRGSQWGGSGAEGSWWLSLRQGPANVVVTDKRYNRVKLHGQQTRCSLIVLDELDKLSED